MRLRRSARVRARGALARRHNRRGVRFRLCGHLGLELNRRVSPRLRDFCFFEVTEHPRLGNHWISLNLPLVPRAALHGGLPRLFSLGRRRTPERSATDVPCRIAEPSWPRISLPIAQLYHSTIRSSNRDTERVFATRRVRARVYLLSARALCSLARRVFPELLESKNATKSAATIAIAFGFNFLPEASPGQGVVSTFGVTSIDDVATAPTQPGSSSVALLVRSAVTKVCGFARG